MRRIVVVGASLAGVNAAQALRETGFDGEVALLGAERHPPYDRPPLSKEALAQDAGPPSLDLHPSGWYLDRGIDLRLGVAAAALDLSSRTVTLADGERVRYDGLVIATGARPRPLPGALRAPGVLSLRTVEDAAVLRSALAPGVRTLVVGAGFIGLEVAAAARAAGAEVTLVDAAPAPLTRALGDQVGAWLAGRHQSHGADVRCGQAIRALSGGPGGYQATLSGGDVIACDLVVAAIGVAPAVDWLRGSGLRIGDGVICDAYCRASAPDVVAAGDVARWYNPVFDEDMRVEHWTNAVEQGRAAALALIGAADRAYAPVPYFWSDQLGMRLRFVGTAFAAVEVRVREGDDGSLTALYQRDGLIRGALCVDALRELALRRGQILGRQRWDDAVGVCSPSP